MIDEWHYEETETFDTRLNRLFWELKQALAFDRGSILLAVYRSEFVREEVEAALTRRLAELGQRTERVYINEQNHDLPMYLRYRADQKTTVYFVSGVRFGGGRDGQNAFRALNFRREYFVEYRLRMVLWLTEEEERMLPLYAPDFWAFRHRVVTFLDDPRPEQIGNHADNLAWREIDSKWMGKGYIEDTTAKIAYRERLLAELPESVETTATRLDLLYTLAPLYAAKGESEQAIAALEQALDLAGQLGDTRKRAWVYNILGNVYVQNGRTTEAIAAYQKAIHLDPTDHAPYNGLGNTYRHLAQPSEAIAAFQKAIDLDPQNAYPFNGLGNVYADLGRIPEAVIAYQKAIDLSPTYAQPYNGLGNVYASVGRYPQAITAYQKAIDLDPNSTRPHNGLGNVYRILGRTSEAIIACRKAIDLDHNYAPPYLNLTLLHIAQEEPEKAIECLEKGLALEPGMRQSVRDNAAFAALRDDPRFQALVGTAVS